MRILLFYIFFLPGFAYSQSKTSKLNPTGSYKLHSKTTKRGGEVYGYFGDLKVKLLSESKIAVTLYICKGAPSYNSGILWDTIIFKKNTAIYIPKDDTTCKITFLFKNNGIIVTQKQSNLNFGCGFGHGVFADGFYNKVSSKIPVIKDPEDDIR